MCSLGPAGAFEAGQQLRAGWWQTVTCCVLCFMGRRWGIGGRIWRRWTSILNILVRALALPQRCWVILVEFSASLCKTSWDCNLPLTSLWGLKKKMHTRVLSIWHHRRSINMSSCWGEPAESQPQTQEQVAGCGSLKLSRWGRCLHCEKT